jgi:hypothetical protein
VPKRARQQFSEILTQDLGDPRFHAMMSMGADFFGDLQKDEPLYESHHLINLPPPREAQLREVVSRPAALLSASFETPDLADSIANKTADESAKDAGALLLLSYLLDDMWTKMVQRGDGVLRLPVQAIELGGVLIERANAFLTSHPGPDDALRCVFTLKLATVREGEEATRRRAPRSEFTEDEWRLVAELADHPNRLLVTATPETGETYAEVAHEAVFKRWEKLRDWIVAEREFLAWETGLEAARRAWQATPKEEQTGALLMGTFLTNAQRWLEKRKQDLPLADRDFIAQSTKREIKARATARRVQTLVYVLLVSVIAELIGWINQASISQAMRWISSPGPSWIRTSAHRSSIRLSATRMIHHKGTCA